jgi:hypothetical protein
MPSKLDCVSTGKMYDLHESLFDTDLLSPANSICVNPVRLKT